MDYFILAETDFFRLINNDGDSGNLNEAYEGFVQTIIDLCRRDAGVFTVAIALTYAENELQHHHTQYTSANGGHVTLFVRKALAFVRKMQKHISANRFVQVPPLSTLSTPEASKEEKAPTSTLRWTGNAIDLVEMIYGIHEMGCVNDGSIPLKQLALMLYSFFSVETKDCYRHYTDIKRRKTVSHTHFLEQMQDRLNERIRRDEEAEFKRR